MQQEAENQQAEDINPEPETLDEAETPEESKESQKDGDQSQAESEEGLEISLGDDEEDSPPQEKEQAPAWVKELRKTNRELQKQNKELQAKVQAQTENQPVELGKKPSLNDFDFDEDAYAEKLAVWLKRKEEIEAESEKQKKAKAQEQERWQAVLDKYNAEKIKVEEKFLDYEVIENDFSSRFNNVQQGLILQIANSLDQNPAFVVYALGKNKKTAAKLAEVQDHIEFVVKATEQVKNMKVTRKKAPAPEKKLEASSSGKGINDSTAQRLLDEAMKTGDITAYHRYTKRNKK